MGDSLSYLDNLLPAHYLHIAEFVSLCPVAIWLHSYRLSSFKYSKTGFLWRNEGGTEKDLAKTIKGIKQESGIKSTKEMISVTYHTKCMWIILNMEVTFKSIHSVGWPDSLVQETK